jgi:hypothetical protein
LYLDTGRLELAATTLEEARVLAEKLVNAFPTVIDYTLDLGTIYHNLGQRARLAREPAAELGWRTRSVSLLEGALKPLPLDAEAWRFLAVAYAGRARVLGELRRHAEMGRDLARLRELDPRPQRDSVRLLRARMLLPLKPGAASPPGAVTQEVPYTLGSIYLLGTIAFRQQTPMLGIGFAFVTQLDETR